MQIGSEARPPRPVDPLGLPERTGIRPLGPAVQPVGVALALGCARMACDISSPLLLHGDLSPLVAVDQDQVHLLGERRPDPPKNRAVFGGVCSRSVQQAVSRSSLSYGVPRCQLENARASDVRPMHTEPSGRSTKIGMRRLRDAIACRRAQSSKWTMSLLGGVLSGPNGSEQRTILPRGPGNAQ